MENNVIFTRRSIREYEKKPVEPEKLDRILRAGMQAPSAMNRQPWEILVVTDPKTIAAISSYSPAAGPAAKAPVVIIPLCNLQEAGEKNKFWPQDLSALTQNIMLEAVNEGLGTCWMGTYPSEERTKALAEYFGLPAHIVPFSMISLGYPAQENKFVDRFVADKVHYEKY